MKHGKKLIIGIVAVIFLALLVSGSMVRFSNWDLLNDKTTGEKVPLALDPYYFMRVAETKMSNNGELPEDDELRVFKDKWTSEILPESMIFLYKTAKIFKPDITFREVNVASPVIFFMLGMIAFFFLILFLTNSKIISLVSSGLLAFLPMYLHRTMAGFSDHEAIGMFAFFVTLLVFTLGMKFLDKKEEDSFDRRSYLITACWGVGLGISSAFTIMAWSGIANFIFMIIPLSFLIFFIIKNKQDMKFKYLPLVFYGCWVVVSLLLPVLVKLPLSKALNFVMLGSSSLLVPAVLGFIIVDCVVFWFIEKRNLFEGNEDKRGYNIIMTLGVLLVLGVFFLFLKGDFMVTIQEIFGKLFNPFGSGRIGETVAENRSPGLKSWLSRMGVTLFWVFYLGMILVGLNLSKEIGKKYNKVIFFILWIGLISGILFSSILPFEKVIYFLSIIAFVSYSFWIYFDDDMNIKTETIIIASWLLFMIIAGRGAIRLFFVLSPFVAFMGGYAVVNLFDYARKTKEDISKIVLYILTIVVAVMLISSFFFSFIPITTNQAESSAPNSRNQWQEAMEWMRTSTPENSTVLHWWDYGYWTQTLGERQSVVDGGNHPSKVVHMIGRYVLTTPNPASALSFIKSNNVSHLIIDPSDLGKYGAYSRIGSAGEMNDRKSRLPVMGVAPSKTLEKSNRTRRFYRGGAKLDEDIVYNKNGDKIFLPKEKSYIGGIILETTKEKKKITIGEKTRTYQERKILKAEGIFINDKNRYKIPLNRVYYDEEMHEFSRGINATFRIVPRVTEKELRPIGGGVYLSPKVSESLFAKLYLMNDPYDEFPSLEIAYKQPSPVLKNVETTTKANVDEFLIYKGFRGPIKIWEVDNISENIKTHEEFTTKKKPKDWEYGMLDKLNFRDNGK